ncbi:AraC family transcriptional regulator [Mucilaginibacter robiniae]|uniref:AraC family transcriptional regulator n=1 Tax=Mucilaginibacter robiniae TaxID=2728022 RepID=A0A7L5E5R9_9SPHI|nr:AraC family transcriptional regulator [Mucilaginibacter robiniae]QJD97737.1 AraC family transcriptional regulator [Mucilaginibacter robiniae]
MHYSDEILNIDNIIKPYFVWFEENWVHDEQFHRHQKVQLVYVESGFQYLTVEGKRYLLPQNHAALIPSGAIHKTNSHSEKIRLMVLFFDVNKSDSFYQEVTVFNVPPVLKEMIKYAEKWSKSKEDTKDEAIFLRALFNELPHFVAVSLQLHIPFPKDKRLTKAIKYLHQHYAEEIKMEDLSTAASLSLRTLERVFKKETGLTLAKHQQILRIIKSLEYLSSNDCTISEIAYKVGYKSLQAYTNSFQSVLQYRPTDFLRKIK